MTTTTTTTTLHRVGGGQQRGTQWWQSNTPHVDEQCVVMVVCIMTIQCHTHTARLGVVMKRRWCGTTMGGGCCAKQPHHAVVVVDGIVAPSTTTTHVPQQQPVLNHTHLLHWSSVLGLGLARVGGTMKHKQGTEPTVLLLGDVVVVCLFGCEVCKCGCRTPCGALMHERVNDLWWWWCTSLDWWVCCVD